MVKKLSKKILYLGSLSLLMIGNPLMAAESQAMEIIKKAYRHIGNTDRFAFDAVVADNLEQDKKAPGLFKHRVSVKVERPGKFRVDTVSSVRDRSSYLNDGTFTMIDRGVGYYGQVKAGKTIDDALDLLFKEYGIRAPLAALLYSDMDRRFKVSASKYFGKRVIDGVECDYVAFRIDKKTVHVWVMTGDEPLVRSYRIIEQSNGEKSDIGALLSWKKHPSISSKDFVFKVPKDAMKISVARENGEGDKQ